MRFGIKMKGAGKRRVTKNFRGERKGYMGKKTRGGELYKGGSSRALRDPDAKSRNKIPAEIKRKGAPLRPPKTKAVGREGGKQKASSGGREERQKGRRRELGGKDSKRGRTRKENYSADRTKGWPS